MGLLSSLFGGKNTKNKTVTDKGSFQYEPITKPASNKPTFHYKGSPDANGLYPSELVMLSYAEKYKTTETVFPGYLTSTYEIVNPAKTLKNLQTRGFIEVGTAKNALSNYKLPELKEIASSIGIQVKGKKADIVLQLSEVDEERLSEVVRSRTWKLTESGCKALKENPYMQFFLEKHTYDVGEVGVDIWSVNKDYINHPHQLYRDIIYSQLNDRMNKASIAVQTDSYAGTANTYQYCECYRIMGLFVEEEGRSYINAADLYFQYLFKLINIHAGFQLLSGYVLFKNDKNYQNEVINRYYENIKLYPYQRTELLRLIDELGIEDSAVRETLIKSFRRAGDTGVMTEEDAADYIIFELNGDCDTAKEMADRLAKQAVKKLR